MVHPCRGLDAHPLAGEVQAQREVGNVYLTWMRRGIEAGVIDPGLREMLDDKEKLHWRVSLRLSQFGDALRHRDAGYLRGVPIAFNSTPFHPSLGDLNFKVLALSDSDELLCVPRMDGRHRLFVLKLLGIERCPDDDDLGSGDPFSTHVAGPRRTTSSACISTSPESMSTIPLWPHAEEIGWSAARD